MPNARRCVATVCVLITAASVVSSQSIDEKRGVYTALFGGDYPSLGRLSQLIVKDVAIPMPSLTGSAADWLAQWADVPPQLRRAAEQGRPTESVAFTSDLFPTGTRLVSARDIEAIFVRGRAEDMWSTFHAQYGAKGWAAFSDVLFTADKEDALVYYEGRCGGLCGEGAYVWLRRDRARSIWVIKKKILRWVS